MKNCELCKAPARTYCESDQASLCWECDAKVHGANFLVTRHSRTLLCHACQSLTPWKASGAKLGNTLSLCESCAGGMKDGSDEGDESEGGNDDDIDTEDDLDDVDEDEDEGGGGDGDEDGDNQVVPLSSTPPPPASNSSSSEESISRCFSSNRVISETASTLSSKRKREDASDLNFQDGWKWWCNKERKGGELKKQVAWLECEGGEGTSKESPRGGEIGPATAKGSNDARTPESV
ncbi:B-box zinc finger protein 19-like [Neltuma alba]|uniref:B-box zinc finger protein 19-like n=1 Tax=Neltuma alba TaxID=207710 RepID=UPI0010A3730F|nr:B-box zinc finger protein 19-like [Prosopis alba]XP_028787777.1 B-box zinc finger protein 19-like [Prosopis alba]